MRIGLEMSQQRLPWADIVERAQFADEVGFDGIWGFDHFQPMYGSGPGECFEGLTTLAALAGLTSRVRLGLLVTGVTYRPPALLASEAITIDHASGGRLELSLGAAWFDKEHRELGFPFPPTGERVTMFEEALQILDGLLTRDDVSFDGKFFRLHDATLLPRPVQKPRPPLWIGAGGERRMLPLVARYADAWHTFDGPAELARKSALLDEMLDEVGRPRSAVLRSSNLDLSQSWDGVRRSADTLRELGVEYLVCGWPSEGRAHLDEFVDKVLPELIAD